MNKHVRNRIVIGLLILTAGIGVLIAQWIDSRNQPTATSSKPKQNLVSEIILATLVDPTKANTPNPQLRQFSSYTTADPIALRITTQPSITVPLQFNARLLTTNGSVVNLAPSTFVAQPGQSIFCCWQIDQPGDYTLQIFRPEGSITSIPFTIRAASSIPHAQLFN